MADEMLVKARGLFDKGEYKDALKILSGLEVKGEDGPLALLLMLLCSYQVRSTGELVKKASASLRSVEIFARRLN